MLNHHRSHHPLHQQHSSQLNPPDRQRADSVLYGSILGVSETVLSSNQDLGRPLQSEVAVFVDVDKKFVFYFNSTGEPVINEIKVFIDRVIEQAAKNNIKMKFIQNHPKEHQQTQTECGIYVLFMIIELLKGVKDPKFFQTETVPDEEMIKLRKVYFN